MVDLMSGAHEYEDDGFVAQDDASEESEGDGFEALIADELAKFRQSQAEKYAELQATSQWLNMPLPSPDPIQQKIRVEERQQLAQLDGELMCQQERSEYVPAACQPDLQQCELGPSATAFRQRPYSAVEAPDDLDDVDATMHHSAESHSHTEEAPVLGLQAAEGTGGIMHGVTAQQQYLQAMEAASRLQSLSFAPVPDEPSCPAELFSELYDDGLLSEDPPEAVSGMHESAEHLQEQAPIQSMTASMAWQPEPSKAAAAEIEMYDIGQVVGLAVNTSLRSVAAPTVLVQYDPAATDEYAAVAEHQELALQQVQTADVVDMQLLQPAAEPSTAREASEGPPAAAPATAVDGLGPSPSQQQLLQDLREPYEAADRQQEHPQGLNVQQAAPYYEWQQLQGEQTEQEQQEVAVEGDGPRLRQQSCDAGQFEAVERHQLQDEHAIQEQVAQQPPAAALEHSQPEEQLRYSGTQHQHSIDSECQPPQQAQYHDQDPADSSGQQHSQVQESEASQSGQWEGYPSHQERDTKEVVQDPWLHIERPAVLLDKQHTAEGEVSAQRDEQPLLAADDSSSGGHADDTCNTVAAALPVAQVLDVAATGRVLQALQDPARGLREELSVEKLSQQIGSDVIDDAACKEDATATAAGATQDGRVCAEPRLEEPIAATPATAVEAVDGDDDFIYQDDDDGDSSSCGGDTPAAPLLSLPVTVSGNVSDIGTASALVTAHLPAMQRTSSHGQAHRSSCSSDGVVAGHAYYSCIQQAPTDELAAWEDGNCSPQQYATAMGAAIAADTAATISPSPLSLRYHGKRPIHGRNRQAATPSPILMTKYTGSSSSGSLINRKLRPESAPTRRMQSPAAAAGKFVQGSHGAGPVGVQVTQHVHASSNLHSGFGSSNSQGYNVSRTVDLKGQAWMTPAAAASGGVGGSPGFTCPRRPSGMPLRPASAERAQRAAETAVAREVHQLQQQRLHAFVRPRPGSADAGQCRPVPPVQQRPNSSSSVSSYSSLRQQHFVAAAGGAVASPRTGALCSTAAQERHWFQPAMDCYISSCWPPMQPRSSRAKPGAIPWDDSPIPLHVPNSMPMAAATQSYAAVLAAKACSQGPGYSALASPAAGHPALSARPKTAGASEAAAILRENQGFTPRAAFSRPYTAGRGMQTALHSDQMGSGSNAYLVDVLQKVRQANTYCRRLGVGKQYKLGRGSKVTWQQQQIAVEVWVLMETSSFDHRDAATAHQHLQQQEPQYSWQLKSYLTLAQFNARYEDLAARVAYPAAATAAEDGGVLEVGSPVSTISCSPGKVRLGGSSTAGTQAWAASRAQTTVFEESLEEQ